VPRTDSRSGSSALALGAAIVLLLLAATPAAASGLPAPIEVDSPPPQLLLIHGGSFLFEDPTFELLTRAPAEAAGFVPHYLRYPLGDMPAAFQAARAEALRLRGKYGSDVYAYGSSAGGTLAALLAGDGLVSAAVAKAPPTDLLGWSWPLSRYGPDYYRQIGLDPISRRRLSPLRRPARRPLLVIQGRADGVVPVAMNRAFAAKFERVRLWVVSGGHLTERHRPRLLARAFVWLARIAPTLS
jgi:pimeloyl-ACP methyl ester carboxylesterase